MSIDIERLKSLYHAEHEGPDGGMIRTHRPATLARMFGISRYKLYQLVGDETALREKYTARRNKARAREYMREQTGYYPALLSKLADVRAEHISPAQKAKLRRAHDPALSPVAQFLAYCAALQPKAK